MIQRIAIAIICLFPWVVGCQPSGREKKPFDAGIKLGTNKNTLLEEASGLAASVANPGCLWTHNDSGNPPEVFLLDSTAKTVKVFRLANVENRDWEDITLGPCPGSNTFCIYVGDIGDNLAHFPYKYIYRFKEPSLNDNETIAVFDTLIVRLPDEVRDTESLMIDPVSHNLYLVSKREHAVFLYEVANPVHTDTVIAKMVGTISHPQIVSADISADGNEVLMKSYEHIFYWKKKGNESIVELLQTPSIKLPYDQEPQGEAIAWARDGSGYYTLSENGKGERGKLYFYKRK